MHSFALKFAKHLLTLSLKAGRTRYGNCIPANAFIPFGTTFEMPSGAMPDLRIDHVLLSPSVGARLRGAGVDREIRGWEKASDHAPTWVEIANDGSI